jgi:receptor protein-tyrosine kinase
MNADAFEPTPSALEELLKNALIERCGLSVPDIASVMTASRTLQVGFADAALHLGLVTRDDIDETADLILRIDPERSSGIIETALRRQAGTRIVPVNNTETVQASKQLILAHQLDNERSERLRALRTELLLLSHQDGFANIFVLVSPGPSEGRSQLCAELAIAFAQLGRRTLLVDGDLRKPSLHFLFNASNQRGLTQALISGERPKTFGVEGLPQLSLLTAGTPAPNPLELLSGGRVERLLSNWRREQEFIIIDTPPITQYADGLALAMMAGRVLVVSRGNITRHDDMKDMLRRLASTHSQILGAVINHF